MRTAINPMYVAYVNQPTGPPVQTFRLFPSTNGPSSSTPFGGTIVEGTAFELTSATYWMAGFWWWVADVAQSQTAQSFALWQITSGTTGTFVTGSQVTSAPLSLGWNYVPYPAALALPVNVPYRATTGLSGNFPFTASQFGAGNPYAAGITSGPLFAFSDTGGSAPFGASAQCSFNTSSSDPTSVYPNSSNSSYNCFIDVQITNAPPAGASYRLWPNMPFANTISADTNGYTMALEFRLAKPATLTNIWWYSAPGAAALPTRCAIWDIGSQTVVAGTDNTSPAWKDPNGSAATAGDGWVKCAYGSPVLNAYPANNYKVAVFYAGGSQWRTADANYFGPSGPGANGLTSGPVFAPSNAGSVNGQSSWHGPNLAWAYPSSETFPENDYVDVEVTP